MMSTELPDLTALANRPTFERQRAEAMGWSFSNIRVYAWGPDQWSLRGDFTCVCGARESFQRLIDKNCVEMATIRRPVLDELMDFALWLRRYGSFSRKHLLTDGYTEEAIREIERKAVEFDAAHGITTVMPPWPMSLAEKHNMHPRDVARHVYR